MKNPNSQVSGIAHISPLLLSEPTDIRKWFSSYTYESPVLDSNEDFCISPTRVDKGEYENKGLYVEDSEDEEVGNCVNSTKFRRVHQSGVGHAKNGCHSIVPISVTDVEKLEFVSDAEIPTCLDSISLPSEPPDIADWFSSYAYESPELDSADFDVSLSANHTFSGSENVDKENDEHFKELTMTVKAELPSCRELNPNGSEMNANSIGTENSKRYPAAQKCTSEGNNLLSENNFCPESVLCRRTRAENLTPLMQEGQETNNADNLMLPANASNRETFTEKCENKTQNISQVFNKNSGWIQLNHKPREAFSKRSKQDEKQYKCTENDENSPQKLGPKKCKIDRNTNPSSFCDDKGAGALTREVFKETTNIQYPCVQEYAGKWRCPQKSKPYAGPPLKQLGLEKWVHRI